MVWGAVTVALSVVSGVGAADGTRCLLYTLAATVATIILGLMYGVPRARAGFVPGETERYASNSNLEQISDWLTKLLIGAGLVEIGNITSILARLGSYLGAGMTIPNAGALCVASVLYGAGTGFTGGYIWTRLRLRLFLETSDRLAAQSAREQTLARNLSEQNRVFGESEPGLALDRAAANAIEARQDFGHGSIAPILWVDDVPDNNRALITALASLEIEVDIAISTAEALIAFDRRSFGLVITDLGRLERGDYKSGAGTELIKAIREKDDKVPIVVFSTQRAMRMKNDLIREGATLVTTRASELFEAVTRAVITTTP